MDLRNLAFRVDFDGNSAAIKEMDGATNKLKDAAEKTTSKLKGMAESFGKIGKNLTAKITVPVVGLATAGTKMALDLEHNIKKVTTLADSDILPVSKIREEVRAISDASGIAQTEIADAVYSALSAGVDSANVMEFVRSGIDLTRAGFTDMATAIDATTTVLNAYGDDAFEISKIHDIFVQTQDKGKISVDELGKSIGRVVPAASSLGVNLDQLGASYAILTAKGQNAQLATTNLNAMLSELGATGSKSDKALREMTGKSFAELTKEGKTVGDVLGMLDEYAKVNDLSLKDMFGSMNAGSAALTLLSDGVEGYNAMLKEMNGATGKTAENARIMEDGWFKINKAMTQVKNTLIDVGAVLAPYIEMAATKVSELTERFNALDEGTKSNIMKFIGLATVAGPVILGVSKIIGVVGSVISIGGKLVGGISTVMGVLGGPLTLALAGAVAAGIALYKNWDKIKEGASKAWEATTKIVEGAVSKIKGFWEGLKNFFKNPIEGIVNIFRRDKGENSSVDGSHARGLARVPYDGYIAELHKGEEVLTADDPRNINNHKNINGSHRAGLSRVPYNGYIAELHKGEEVLTADDPRNINNYRNVARTKQTTSQTAGQTTTQIAGKLWDKITGRNKQDERHRTRLSRVPYDGHIVELHKGEDFPIADDPKNINNYKNITRTSNIQTTTSSPKIYYNPTFNIEVNGNATEQEITDLENRMRKVARESFQDFFYELSLKMA